MLSNDAPTQIWHLQMGGGPLVATAVHDGHQIRDELVPHLALEGQARLREEDPFTGRWTAVADTRVIVERSRFEVDLNRPRLSAVYRKPEDCWGLKLWRGNPPEALFARSMEQYDHFYRSMKALLAEVSRAHGAFVLYDIHSYNHRRNGPDGEPADVEGNPQINVGTGSVDRARWGSVIDALMGALRTYDFPGGRLDVRENVKFRGGNWPTWINQNFPEDGVAIALEFKKFFMDEWTGEPDEALLEAVTGALRSTVDPVLSAVNGIIK